MAERKNTNPFSSDDSNNPHLPPTVYQPNPYPINPAEGNPWARPTNDYQQTSYQPTSYQPGHVDNNTSSTYSYGHGYNTSSDGSNQYMSMPTPTVNAYNTNSPSYNTNSSSYNYDPNAYSNNAYNNTPAYNNANTNAYENSQPDNVKDEADNNSTSTDLNEASSVNPGIETHDPDKLKISSQMVKTSFNSAPNKWRLLSRFIQFIASVGAFVFIVGAKPVSKVDTPKGANNIAIIFLYIVSAVSIIYSFSHLIFYCVRRWGHKNKAPRWALMLVDALIGASFGALMVFLIKDFRCKIGDLNGWCDFYNTSIFFTVLAFVTYFVSFIWDIVGGFIKRS